MTAGVSTELCSEAKLWDLTAAALDGLPPHPALPGLDSATSATGCLLPCLASDLVLAGKTGWAAALVTSRLRLHPSLSGLSGGIAFLDKFLRDSSSLVWKAPAASLEADTDGLAHAAPRALASVGLRLPTVMQQAILELSTIR